MHKLTHSQLEIWNSQQFHPNSALYNENIYIELGGDLDANKLSVCWKQLVNQNPVLKTRIGESNGAPYQEHNGIEPKLTLIDYSDSGTALNDAKKWMKQQSELTIALNETTLNTALIKLSASRWIWFIQQHHIAADAWSISLIWNKLTTLYKNEHINQKIHINENECVTASDATLYTYKDFLDQYNFESVYTEELASHWQSRQVEQPLSLYGRKPKSSTTSCTRLSLATDPGVVENIETMLSSAPYKTFNRQIGQYQIYLSVVIAWIHRISNERDITFNMPSAGRNTKETRNCIGYFIELLPFRVSIPEQSTFEDLYKCVQAETMRFIRYTDNGVCQFNKHTRPNIFFNFITSAFNQFPEMETKVHWLHVNQIDASQSVRVHIVDWQNTGVPQVVVDFNDAWFNEAERNRAIEHLNNALTKYTEVPDARLASPSLISPHDEWRITDKNTQWKPDEAAENIQTSILASCEQYADKIAIKQSDVEITYRELAAYSRSFSAYLNNAGVGPGDRVIIHMDREWQLLPALLGTMLSGAMYVPIDISTPKERVRKIESNAAPSLILTSRRYVDLFEAKHLCFAIEDALPGDGSVPPHSNSDTFSPVNASSAYILYTSGSTGEPKGVEVNHKALFRFLCWTRDQLSDNKPLNFPLVTSIGFDITATPLYVTLMTGGTLHTYPGNGESDAFAVLEMIKNPDINALYMTPSQLSLVSDDDLGASNLTKIVLLGEQLKTSYTARLESAFNGQIAIFNKYGPTECTIASFYQKYDKETHKNTSVPIGLPTAGTEGLVLNGEQKPQLQGLPGELYLAGPLLANGYWRDPARTEQAFLYLPDFPNTRLYKTGDLVRVNEQGRVEYLGRNDSQIKRSGIRLELGEIESAAISHTDIRAAAVKLHTEPATNSIPRPSDNVDSRIVLYYVSDSAFDEDTLKHFLLQHLSETTMPDQTIWLRSMPMNVNGKTDYAKLPDPADFSIACNVTAPISENDLPKSEIQRQWVSIWSSSLSTSNLGINDNFFCAGGNSLTAIKVVSEMNEHGYNYEPADLFRNPTIQSLSKISRVSTKRISNQSTATTPFSGISKADLTKLKSKFKVNDG